MLIHCVCRWFIIIEVQRPQYFQFFPDFLYESKLNVYLNSSQIKPDTTVPYTKYCREVGKPQPSPYPHWNSEVWLYIKRPWLIGSQRVIHFSLFYYYILHCSPFTLTKVIFLFCTNRFKKNFPNASSFFNPNTHTSGM